MDWMNRMNSAIGYIEAHLDEDIDMDEVGRLAKCSAYHFQRVFTYMAGITLREYIHRRRLTLAAFALQDGAAKVIDVAVQYGYDSPAAFSRAFCAFHGIKPSEAKASDKPFVSYPPISFQITIKGGAAMNYRILNKEAFRVVGYKLETTMENDEAFRAVPEFWGMVGEGGKLPEIAALNQKEPKGVLGVSVGDWKRKERVDYYIAAATDLPVPEGMHEYTVPASQWAVFEGKGVMPGAIQQMQKRVVTEWLPSSGYDYGDAPDLEVYRSDGQSPESEFEVWLPVIKK